MKKNSPVERLYNGIIKENPTLFWYLVCVRLWQSPTAAINGIGTGTYYNRGSGNVQLVYLSFEKYYSGQSTYAGLYCSSSLLCNHCPAFASGLYSSFIRCLGNLYSSYCSKLYYFRKSGVLCV